jgi:hypothetical protein
MSTFVADLKHAWLDMLEPPWRRPGRDNPLTWRFWFVGWIWAVAGLILGAFIAPTVLQRAGLADSDYQDAFNLAVAVLTGFLVQFLGWIFAFGVLAPLADHLEGMPDWVSDVLYFPFVAVFALLPVAGVGYALYRYLTWVGVGQRSIAVAFVVGLLVKAFIIPTIWGVLKSKAFRLFMRWLRGDTVKPRGA